MLREQNLKEFCESLASVDPVPGGGSVAADAGALAASLVSMVAKTTIGKSGYEDAWEDMEKLMEQADNTASRMLELVDEDAQAYQAVVKAFRMPKEDEVDRVVRLDAIQAAFRHAAEVPLTTMRTGLEALRLAAMAAHKGNKNTLTDAGVAALMCCAAIESARYNVLINLPSIKDEAFVADAKDKVQRYKHDADEIHRHISEFVDASL